MADINLSLGFDQSKVDEAIDKISSKLNKIEKEQSNILKLQEKYEETIESLRYQEELELQTKKQITAETSRGLDEAVNKSAELTERYEELNVRADKFKSLLSQARIDPKNFAESDGYLSKSEQKTNQIGKNIGKSIIGMKNFSASSGSASLAIERFSNRITGLAKTVLIFSVVARAFNRLRIFIFDAMKTNDQFSNSLAQLKGNLLIAAQPILEALTPALTWLIQMFARATAYVAKFISLLLGKNIQASVASAKALNKQSSAANKVAGANNKMASSAKKANKQMGKQLLGFDELNKLEKQNVDTQDDVGRAAIGGAAIGGAIAGPISEEITPKFDFNFDDIDLSKVQWIADTFNKLKESIQGFIDVLKGDKSFKEWVDELSPLQIILFSLAAAIAIVVVAIAAVIAIVAIANIVFLISTSYILLIVLAIAVLIVIILFLIKYWDQIKEAAINCWNAIVDALSNFVKWLWSEVIIRIIKFFVDLWDGIKEKFKLGIEWIKNKWSSISENLVGVFNNIINNIKNKFESFKNFISEIVGKIKNFFSEMWGGISDGAKSAWQGICKGVITMANFLINALNKMIEGVLAPLNLLIDGLNLIPNVKIPKLHLAIPTISLPPIPALAKGAVLPPNKPFMAMVGDQSHGTNIEAPLDTIVNAFEKVISDQQINVNFKGSMAQLVRILKPEIERETRRVSVF